MTDAVRHDRSWELVPRGRDFTSWSVDPPEGVVQGPLDLDFFAGGRLHVVLEEGQMGLLSVDGELHLHMMEGVHLLRVGGDDGLPADGRLHFVHLDAPIRVPWRQHVAVRGEGAREAHGHFDVTIADPSLFHRAFLTGDDDGEALCIRKLSTLLPALLAGHLAASVGDGDLSERAAALDPSVLDPDLAAYGLACTAVVAEKTVAPQPVVVDAR